MKQMMQPMNQMSSGISPEMMAHLKEAAEGKSPKEIKAMIKKMKERTGEEVSEEIKTILMQIAKGKKVEEVVSTHPMGEIKKVKKKMHGD
ncbi:MAG: hypothetical protein H7642_10585 [Candidatus Heimdallarchaeota archaeon]|nr:hypothetical protein [Candidatus Heimdallarchaeota archaeon]